ncbi:ATP-binding protein [Streptomyces albofaciens JCM 4342]|uniref:AAA family ATPase n=1 Tax=Streptomyces albofaciens TaxID=66866 RepID=UPI00123A021B|nr:AAA family ATPase [Streptomyces albofaciens]KAA6213857.1 ATP-binding protein [Streptomyces albofaciens JCM 4342]
MHRQAALATSPGGAPPGRVPEPTGAVPEPRRLPLGVVRPGRTRGAAADVVDLRGRPDPYGTAELHFATGDIVVVSGLPGSGKSTLMLRVVPALDGQGAAVHRVDSQDVRERWERGRLRRLPYALYRPLVRASHYLGLRRALRSGGSVVVHDCGTLAWVRRWLAREARRGGRGLHLMLLDVPPEVALSGQRSRGRGVSGYAFARHRRAVRRLTARARAARLPAGFTSAVLLDRPAAGALRRIGFE